MEKIENKFIRYVKIDTESSETSTSYPSTFKQFDLAKLLTKELEELGFEVELDKYGLVYAKLDGDPSLAKIGLIAHMDTAPTIRGGNFEPRFVYNYDGNDIKLNQTYSLSPNIFPSLKDVIGKTLIVTDGEHLLGGDDKAGIAIIMAIAEYYATNKEIRHASIRICFTPDEEIGAGADHFDVEKMDADIAYTLDGGESREINFENFNAAGATISFKGVSIHPGSAKNIMVNALLLAQEFNSLLPNFTPSNTEGYEGFYHLTDINGDAEFCKVQYILRDHDKNLLNEKKETLLKTADILNKKYPTAKVEVEIKDQYENMKYYFENNPLAIDKITSAYKKVGLEYYFSPIRGGTDGARITYMGLPCPNIGTGDRCCHGRFEHVVVEEMYEMFDVVKALLEN